MKKPTAAKTTITGSERINIRLIEHVTADVGEYVNIAAFNSIERALTQEFGESYESLSRDTRQSSGGLYSQRTESWQVDDSTLILTYDSSEGLKIVEHCADHEPYVWLELALRPVPKRKPKKVVPEDLLTPRRFNTLWDIMNEDDGAPSITQQNNFVYECLTRMLGDGNDCASNSVQGGGEIEWEVGSARLVFSWSRQGMTLKLKDTSNDL